MPPAPVPSCEVLFFLPFSASQFCKPAETAVDTKFILIDLDFAMSEVAAAGILCCL